MSEFVGDTKSKKKTHFVGAKTDMMKKMTTLLLQVAKELRATGMEAQNRKEAHNVMIR